MMIALLAPIVLAAAAPVPVQAKYSVILAVTYDAESAITELKVSRVIDPLKGTTPLAVDVPPEWLAKARLWLESRKREPGKPGTFYVYAYYVPAFPDRLWVGDY